MNLPGRWLVMGGGLLFLVGVLFGRLVSPRVYREETVMVIGSASARGCEGYAGVAPVFFGMPRGQSDGRYRVACGEWTRVSEDAQLLCTCPESKAEQPPSR